MSKLQFENGKMISSSKYGQQEEEAATLELTATEQEMEKAIKVPNLMELLCIHTQRDSFTIDFIMLCKHE